jgi:DNA-binding response OmpR family regulator
VGTILLVQADLELNDGWSLALEASGHTVLAARAIADGLVRVREGGIDVIVVDGNGDVGGLSSFVTELERLPDSPPFVLVSSSPDAPEISARLGAAAFLPKPCSTGDLDSVVARLSPTAVTEHLDDEPTLPRITLPLEQQH